MTTEIHPTAIVHETAQLGTGVRIGPWCIVGAHVKLGAGCVVVSHAHLEGGDTSGAQLGENCFVGPFCLVGPRVQMGANNRLVSHATVTGNTQMGDGNEVYPGASVGNPPQDKKWNGEDSLLLIGHRNVIREGATLQPGTAVAINKTVLGDDNLLMAGVHIAHDCLLGNGNILANYVQLAGHVTMGNNVTVGGISGFHQFVRVGDGAMMGGCSKAVQDIPPYTLAQGNEAVLRGLNVVGLKRRGMGVESLQALKKVYKEIFQGGHPTIAEAVTSCREKGLLSTAEAEKFVEFIASGTRGVTRPESGRKNQED